MTSLSSSVTSKRFYIRDLENREVEYMESEEIPPPWIKKTFPIFKLPSSVSFFSPHKRELKESNLVISQKSQTRFLYRKMLILPKINLLFLMKGGSFYEGKEIEEGSFYLLSKMLISRTRRHKKTKFDLFLSEHGIEILPIFSSHYFGFKLIFLRDKIQIASDVFREILFESYFSEIDFATEKKDLLFKILSHDENPWQQINRHFKKYFYQKTPFGNEILGTTKSVKRITLSCLRYLKTKTLDKNNSTLSVYGDLSMREMKKYFYDSLEILPTHKTAILDQPIRTQLHSIPTYSETKKIKGRELQQSYFQIGYRAPVAFSEDHVKFHFFNSYLSGMGGDLFKMRSQSFTDAIGVKGGRCYQLGCGYKSNAFYGSFLLYAGLRRGAEEEYPWIIDSFKKNYSKRIATKNHGRRMSESSKSFYRQTNDPIQ